MIPLWVIVLIAVAGGAVLGFGWGILWAANAQAAVEQAQQEKLVALLTKAVNSPKIPPEVRTTLREILLKETGETP